MIILKIKELKNVTKNYGSKKCFHRSRCMLKEQLFLIFSRDGFGGTRLFRTCVGARNIYR